MERLYDPGFWLFAVPLWIVAWLLMRSLRRVREAILSLRDRRIRKAGRQAAARANERMKWGSWQ